MPFVRKIETAPVEAVAESKGACLSITHRHAVRADLRLTSSLIFIAIGPPRLGKNAMATGCASRDYSVTTPARPKRTTTQRALAMTVTAYLEAVAIRSVVPPEGCAAHMAPQHT